KNYSGVPATDNGIAAGGCRAAWTRPRAGRGMTTDSSLMWHPLDVLAERFRANLDALAGRDPELAERLERVAPSKSHFIAARGDDVFLGRQGPVGIELLPNPVTPAM